MQNQIVCDWSTYKGSHCKKIVNGTKFCDLHNDLINSYSKICCDDFCETFKEIKIVPRSYKHIKAIMSGMKNEDDIVQVYLAGGSIEEADISNMDFIVLNSDNSKFFYLPKRGQNKAKDLKIILRDYCQNNSVISLKGVKYCEECYKKLKDVPRISII